MTLSRRQVLRLFALLAGAKALAAEKPKSGDNGIGGTGFKPADNGIGGTGFIGTIRRFGSVWVNGARIAYPPDVRIRIDGEAAGAGALRIGQVARLVAEPRDGTWRTDGIVVVSEAVGPVSRIAGRSLELLGQRVQLAGAAMAHGLKVGDRVAVGGLRRPDQTIVASLIEKRAGGPDQIAGLLTEDGGAYRIGGQIVTGAVGGGVAGERVVALGALENGVFVARTMKLDTIVTIGAVRNVSVEAWVSGQDGALVTAGGLRVEGGAAGLPAGARRIVIDGALGANGALIASRIALPTRTRPSVAVAQLIVSRKCQGQMVNQIPATASA